MDTISHTTEIEIPRPTYYPSMPIPGTHGKYFVTYDGRIINGKTRRTLKPQKHHAGYQLITIVKDNKRWQNTVHKFVALAWLENPNGYDEINHKDGDKQNNAVWNLEWTDRKQNMQHAAKCRLMHSKIKIGHVHIIRNLLKAKCTIREITKFLNERGLQISRGVVQSIKYNKAHLHV
jgi:hypothetical protein